MDINTIRILLHSNVRVCHYSLKPCFFYKLRRKLLRNRVQYRQVCRGLKNFAIYTHSPYSSCKVCINGKVLETPAYLPVLHPVSQELPSQLIKEAGFEAVMTNSYITMKKYPDRVDIHKLTSFDGIIMTDSGGYQALMYGAIDAEPARVAEYQVKIGSDIAVILDLPTGSSRDKKRAEMTVHETYSAAKKSLPFMKKPPAWAAPIQGGSFEDLVMQSARRMSSLPFDMFAIGSPVEFMNNYKYREVVKLITAAKKV